MAHFVIEIAQLIRCSVEAVDLSRALKNFVVAVGRKIGVFASAYDKEWARRDQCSDDGEIG